MNRNEHELSIQQDLKQVYKILKAGTHKENAGMLQVILSELIDNVRTNINRFEAPQTSEKETMHFSKFTKISRKAKSKTIAELEEVLGELTKRKPNIKRCLLLIEGIIESNLHTNSVVKLIDKWKPLQERNLKIKHMVIK